MQDTQPFSSPKQEKENKSSHLFDTKEENEGIKVSPLSVYKSKPVKISKFPNIKPHEIAKNIDIIYNHDNIDIKTICQIYEKSIELAKTSFVNLTFDNRKGNLLKNLDIFQFSYRTKTSLLQR